MGAFQKVCYRSACSPYSNREDRREEMEIGVSSRHGDNAIDQGKDKAT